MSHDTRGQDDHDRGIRNEQRLCQIDDKWIAHNVVHELEAQALRLQHDEYERRLNALNNEAGRIAENNAKNVSREVYDAEQKEVGRRAEALAAALPNYVTREVFDSQTNRITALEKFTSRLIGIGLVLTLLAAAAGAAITKALGG